MKHGPLEIKRLLESLEAGEITENEFLFKVRQNVNKLFAKSQHQTGIRPFESRMGHAKKVCRPAV